MAGVLQGWQVLSISLLICSILLKQDFLHFSCKLCEQLQTAPLSALIVISICYH